MITQRAPRLLKEIGRASHKLDAARAELADKREALLRLARSASYPFYYFIIVVLCLNRCGKARLGRQRLCGVVGVTEQSLSV